MAVLKYNLKTVSVWLSGAFQDQYPGFVRVLKTLEFEESDFKAFKVLGFRFGSLKVLDFLLNKIEKYLLLKALK